MSDKCPKCGAALLGAAGYWECCACKHRSPYPTEADNLRCQIAAEKAVNAHLRAAGHRLEAALNRIDCALLSPEQVAADTAAVGGPVGQYGVDYDEDGVVERVRSEINRLREAAKATLKDKQP